MKRALRLLLVGIMLFSCKPQSQIDSQTQNFGISVDPTEKLVFLDMLQLENSVFNICLVSQKEGPETAWTKKVKGMFTESMNTWVDAVNRRQPGTFKKSFSLRFIDLGYETYELQTKEDPKEVAESFASTEKYGSQIQAAKTDEEVQAIFDSFAREETAYSEKLSRISACEKTNLTIVSYDDTERILKVTKSNRVSFLDSDFLNQHPLVASKLNRTMFQNTYSDFEFISKMAEYRTEEGRLREWVLAETIYLPKLKYSDLKFQEKLNHEFGHVLGLLDVYAEFKTQQSSIDITLMASHREARGIPQESDVQGILTLLAGGGKGKVGCPSGFEAYEKPDIVTFRKSLFCRPILKKPTSEFR